MSAKVETAPDALKPGDWVWAPSIAPAGPMLIYVDLSRQIAAVYRNGVRIGLTTISSGKKGHATPTGTFTILERASVHHSSKYDEASMPFTERLTWDGVALHAGGVPGYPESHGCIHLPYGFAKALFSATRRGVPVVVAGNAVQRPPTEDSTFLQPIALPHSGDGPLALDDAAFSWKPELSPLGPLTIVISRADQMIVVLRDGVEIGRGAARIDDDDDDPGSHVLTVTDWPDGKPRFVYVALPGHDDDIAKAFDEATLDRVHLDRAFLKVVRAQLTPGTTVLITDAGVGADPDKRITVARTRFPQRCWNPKPLFPGGWRRHVPGSRPGLYGRFPRPLPVPGLEDIIDEAEAAGIGHEPAVGRGVAHVEAVNVVGGVDRVTGRGAERQVHGEAGQMGRTAGSRDALAIAVDRAAFGVRRGVAETRKDGEQASISGCDPRRPRRRDEPAIGRERGRSQLNHLSAVGFGRQGRGEGGCRGRRRTGGLADVDEGAPH